MKTDLSKYNNDWYKPGANLFVRIAWYIFNWAFFVSYCPFNFVKIFLLRMFGAKIGKGVVLKPHINIKYPWKISIGENAWIGENVWLDSLGKITIGANACLSQGALLLCGNHNYKKSSFDLIVNDIILEDGVWIGAKAVVCGGVVAKSHSVLTSGSVATSTLEPYSVYQGNPAVKVKEREITS